MIVARIAVRDVAADRGRVANNGIGDHSCRVVQQRIPFAHDGGLLEVRLPRQRSDVQRSVTLLDVFESIDSTDVDEHARRGKAELQHRDETLSARQDFRFAAVLGCEQREGRYVCAGSPGIDTLVDQSEFLDRLFSVTRVFRVGVLLIAFVMLIAASILIANTVRMGLFARRKEIGIMKLVGATNWRIRIPFLIEGVFESLIGAAAAILFLFGMKVLFINPLYGTIQFIPWVTNSDVLAVVPWLLVAGVAVALLAGLVGMRRFLDV